MAVYLNRIQFTTATTGTGAMTVGAAVSGFQTPATASLATGSQVGYTILDSNGNWEVGLGTYTSSTTSLSRDTVESSSAGGTTKISCSGAATMFLTVTGLLLSGMQTAANVVSTLTTPPAIGATTPNTGAFTTLSATSTVSGSGFTTLLSPYLTTSTASSTYYLQTNPSGYQTAANVTSSLSTYAPLASPSLTGTPLAPTATAGTNTTQIATTQFVTTAISSNYNPAAVAITGGTINGTAVGGTAPSSINASSISNTGGAVETQVAMTANNINLAQGTYFTKTISANTTLTISNTPVSGSVAAIILELTNGGAYTITWWGTIKWNAGTAPTLSTSGLDSLGFYTIDGGTTWRGLLLGKGMA